MAIPKCANCEYYGVGYGRIPYRICRKASKIIEKIGGYKTSPAWCPLRNVAKSATTGKDKVHENV